MIRPQQRRCSRTVNWVRAATLAFNALFCNALICTVLGAAPAAAQTDTPLRLWHAYTGAEEEALREAARRYESEHGQRVELLAVAFGAYLSKLESSIPTGQGPDLFIDAHERLANLVAQGLVVPWSGNEDLRASFPETHRNALSLDGTVFALPLAAKCAALYRNTDLFPQAPASLEALLGADLPEGVYNLALESENAYYVAALLHAFGGKLLDAEGTYRFEGDAAAATLELLTAAQNSGALPEEANGELVKRLFTSGQAGAAISGPWLAPDLPESLAWQVSPLPRLAATDAPLRPYTTVEGIFLAAETDASRHPAARAFAAYLAGPAGAALRLEQARQIVSHPAPWSEQGDAFLSTFRSACEAGLPLPAHPNMRLAFEPAQRSLRQALRTGAAPVDALSTGRRIFDDLVRPLPPPAEPMPYVLAIGALCLGLLLRQLYRLRDPEHRVALRESIPAYRYLAHAAVAVGLLVLLPIAVGFAMSLFAGRGRDSHYFVGLANYGDILTARGGELFGDGSFYLVLLVTVLWTVLNLALHLGIGMALALLLNRPTLRFRGLYRVLLILPWAVPSYVTALAWKGMFHRQFGAINALIEALGGESISFFAQWTTAFGANLTTNVWLGFPFMMVITLGALTSIPNDLYEAAAVDGATPWQRFRHVTLPMLIPVLAPAIAMGAVWTFNMFNVVFLVSAGEPDGRTEILVSEAYRWAFTRSNQLGYASAYAVLIFGILLLGTRALNKLTAAPEDGA